MKEIYHQSALRRKTQSALYLKKVKIIYQYIRATKLYFPNHKVKLGIKQCITITWLNKKETNQDKSMDSTFFCALVTWVASL